MDIWPFATTQGVRVYVRTECLFSRCSMLHIIWYETWLISRWKCVDLLTPLLSGQWCLCVLNNCYHVAVMCCSLNFTCSMTIFRKSFILDSPPPLNLPRGSDPGIQSNIRSDIFHIFCCFWSVYIQSFVLPMYLDWEKMKNDFGNNIENWLSYCQIHVFDLWPCGRGIYFYILHRHTYLQAFYT